MNAQHHRDSTGRLFALGVVGILLAAGLVAGRSLEWPGLYYDEAVQARPALEWATGDIRASALPGSHAVWVGGRPFPLMTQPYMGGLKSQVLAGPFWLFGPDVRVLRGITLGIALLGIGVLAFFARRAFGKPTGWLVTLLLAPVALNYAFASAVLQRFEPDLLGIYFVSVWPAICLVVFAVMMWWRRGWRSHWIIFVALALAMALLLVFVVSAVFMTSYDFRALSYSLLSINLLPLAFVAFTVDVDPLADKLASADLDHFSAVLAETTAEPQNAAQAGSDRVHQVLDLMRKPATIRHAVAYAFSLVILCIYGAANAKLAPEETERLGWAVAGCLVFTDLLVFGMHRAAMLTRGPYFTVFVLALTRFLFVSFDVECLFLGFCCAFIVFGIHFGTEITNRRLRAETLHVEAFVPSTGLLTG